MPQLKRSPPEAEGGQKRRDKVLIGLLLNREAVCMVLHTLQLLARGADDRRKHATGAS